MSPLRKTTLLTVVLLCLSQCCCKPSSGEKLIPPQQFPTVTIPPVEPDPAAYAVSHWFNRLFDSTRVFNTDTSLVMGVTRESFIEAFRMYARLLGAVPCQKGMEAQRKALRLAESYQIGHPESNIWKMMLDANSAVIDDPNSPERSEDMYVPVLEAMIASPLVDSLSKLTPAYKLPLYSLNRRGTKAADFRFTTSDGRISSLYATSGDFILILFSNPGCDACKTVIRQINDNILLDGMIRDGCLKVINCYPDEDLKYWNEYRKFYPGHWINCYDHLQALNSRTKYNLRAIPSLYLLDREYTVLLKDAPLEAVIEAVSEAI